MRWFNQQKLGMGHEFGSLIYTGLFRWCFIFPLINHHDLGWQYNLNDHFIKAWPWVHFPWRAPHGSRSATAVFFEGGVQNVTLKGRCSGEVERKLCKQFRFWRIWRTVFFCFTLQQNEFMATVRNYGLAKKSGGAWKCNPKTYCQKVSIKWDLGRKIRVSSEPKVHQKAP